MAKSRSTSESQGWQARGETMPTQSNDLSESAVGEIAEHLNTVLADVFAIYLKTKNFHWHMSGAHFREYHKLLGEQAEQLIAATDPIAERVRKLGAPTLRSVGDIGRRQRAADSDVAQADPLHMIVELCHDNRALLTALREARSVCENNQDTASAHLIDDWIDETEHRVWYLFEITRQSEGSGEATRH